MCSCSPRDGWWPKDRPGEVKARAGARATISFRADGIPMHLLEQLPGVEAVALVGGRATVRTADPNGVVAALLDRAPRLTDLQVAGTPLEDAFLALTSEQRP